ncbi:preprotein translocase subunit SecG [Acidaminobacterium chupaoyuni]
MSETVRLILTIIQVIISVLLVLTVIFQSGKQAGMSGSIDGAADTFFGKNKARSLDAKLEKMTTVVAICFIVLTFVLTIL